MLKRALAQPLSTEKKNNKPNHNKTPLSSQPTIEGITLSSAETSQNAPLGSIAKFASHTQQNNKNKRDEATIKRFKLQKVAAKLLSTKRVSNCQRLLVPNAQTVDVHYQPEGHSAHYKNLRTCDSVWDCPVCAAKITERRRVELMLAIARARDEDLTPILVTFTLRHNRGDKLGDLLTALKTGYRKFKSGRAYQAIKDDLGIVGSVVSTEVTNGHGREKNNGWHPHLHALVFVMPYSAQILVRNTAAMKERWSHVLDGLGYDATWERGVDVKEGDAAIADYVAKWGHEPKNTRWTVERELTKAPVKQASDDGVTPFGLLEQYDNGDQAAGTLFREYSAVFHGRAQLVWSRGLRALLGVGEEKTDEEVNSLEEEGAELLTSITRYTWFRLTRLASDVRGELLTIAAAGDVDKFQRRIIELVGADATSPPPKKKVEVMSVAEMCVKCLGQSTTLVGDGTSSDGRHYDVLLCSDCKNYTRVFDNPQTEKEVVIHEIALENKPFPVREAKIEEQLRLPLTMAYQGES